MKKIQQFGLLLLASVMMLMTACVKNIEGGNVLPNFVDGNAPVLSITSTTFAPAAADSNNSVLTLNWTNPRYSVDPATVRFVVQVDTINGNFFRNPVEFTVTGVNSLRWLNKEFNNLLLSFGLPFNVARAIDIRVISSHGNNNERLISNVIRVAATPYRIPPRIPLPTSGRVFIVGDATDGGWNNPVPTPSQELARIDETTWGGVFNLKGGSYLLLPINGSWDQKYALTNGSAPGIANGGSFAYYAPGVGGGDNFPSPTTTPGLYRIRMDFQAGTFSVTPFAEQHGLPTNLFIVGGATPGGWNNPVPTPAQQFTRLNSAEFQIASLRLTAGEKYLFLPTNGDWSRKFGAVNGAAPNIGLGGPMAPEGADMPAPATTGNYRITVNFFTYRYTLTAL